jgi:hypothetical protein
MSELDYVDDTVEAPVFGFALKHGLILGALSIAMSLAMHFTGLIGNQWVGYLLMLVIAIACFLFQKKFRDTEQGGFITFGKAFSVGLLMYVVSTILGTIYNAWYWNAFPESIENMMEQQYQGMVDQGMSGSEIDMAMEMTEQFMTPTMMIVFGVVFGIIGGIIISLITSAIVKREQTF